MLCVQHVWSSYDFSIIMLLLFYLLLALFSPNLKKKSIPLYIYIYIYMIYIDIYIYIYIYIYIMALWCSGYHYCTTSLNEAWTQVLHRFKSCSQRVKDSQWWRSLRIIQARNKAKCLSSVNHTAKTIHHHHHHPHHH